MRGDRPLVERIFSLFFSFTPHARGSTFPLSLSLSLSSVYPACAGIDLVFLLIVSVTPCLPRMRGDRPVPELGPDKPNEFTPHARGSTFRKGGIIPFHYVYPACAGIDLYLFPNKGRREGLPRMRGDRPLQVPRQFEP